MTAVPGFEPRRRRRRCCSCKGRLANTERVRNEYACLTHPMLDVVLEDCLTQGVLDIADR